MHRQRKPMRPSKYQRIRSIQSWAARPTKALLTAALANRRSGANLRCTNASVPPLRLKNQHTRPHLRTSPSSLPLTGHGASTISPGQAERPPKAP